MEQKVTEALKRLSYGIYIVTVKSDDDRNLMIASWVSQVSRRPPRVMVAIRKNRRTHSMINESQSFALHALEKGETDRITRFKSVVADDRFEGISLDQAATGSPIIKDSLAYLDCKLVDTVDTGDHTLFIGEVQAADAKPSGVPMTTLDYGKTYIG